MDSYIILGKMFNFSKIYHCFLLLYKAVAKSVFEPNNVGTIVYSKSKLGGPRIHQLFILKTRHTDRNSISRELQNVWFG